MSCVIGLVDEGDIYIGADGFATTEDGERRPIFADKILRNKSYLIGYTGSIRTGQILDSHNFDPPDDIKDLPESLREHLYAKGCVATTDGGLSMQTCNFLIGFKGHLYEILMDFQLNEVLGNFTAIGSGGAYAMGAMYVVEKTSIEPLKKLEYGLLAASEFHTSCGPPFSFDKL